MPKRAVRTTTRNTLLAALSPELRGVLLPKLDTVPLHARQVLVRPETRNDTVYFPESGWLSLIAAMDDGTQGEVGCVGREGMVPPSLILGANTSYAEICVHDAGTALCMPAEPFRAEMAASPPLRARLLRYAEAMHAQAMQIAVCNGRHPLDQRLARWLLMAHDRIDGNEITITQETLGLMLCVYRPSVSVAASGLQRAAIIRYQPGRITILDRAALESVACGCYRMVAARFRQLLG
ncbi:Crp/Fnr family transcriptional regulator [Rhodopila globiformis]|uniref:Cyclic nucleotide-binding domain-containing protein n=1 Tax=Rhodopila globiformis TaxID=1071 RepID=A0A2S6NJC3_RHOGL|nr:Crp/Fnr family transcriptional regulator [Rhodopila globiformis]PPQ34821.1 hypothetical protein CCS01_09535 [Rhodopila globiformis]